MVTVVVTGLPGSGKTTLAGALAGELRLPLISKDFIKETLSDVLSPEVDSRQLGLAAIAVLLGLAAAAPDVVLESFFWPGVSEPELLALGRPLLQVHCDCPPEIARQRFEQRTREGLRHHVHHGMDSWDRFVGKRGLLELEGRLITVDTTRPVDVEALARQVRRASPPNN